MKIQIDIPNRTICDLLITVFEGGCSPWINSVEYAGHAKGGTVWYDDPFAISQPGTVFALNYDLESDDEGSFTGNAVFGYGNLSIGTQLFAQEHPRFSQVLSGDFDAPLADAWFQFVVFGQVIYG